MKASRFFNLLVTVLAVILGIAGLVTESVLGLPSPDYPLYCLLCLVVLAVSVKTRMFNVPRKYLAYMLALVALMTVNALVSKYSPGIMYSLIGGAITIMPFVLFVVFYNVSMTDSEIHRYIHLMIGVILFVSVIVLLDSFVLHTSNQTFQNSVLSSGIIAFGNFSSICNQAIVLALAEYFRTHKRAFLFITAYLIAFIVVTNQLKAILGMMLILTGYVFYMIDIKRWVKIMITSAGILAMVLTLSISAAFMLKFENYFSTAMNEEAYAKVARPALYLRGFEIANDFFPLGAGQGTYGSVPVNIVGSRVYSDYGLDKVWGLGDDTDFSFKMDAHWASILGEMGYAGMFIYLCLFFYPARNIRKRMSGEDRRTSLYYSFIIRMGIVTLFIESLVLALPKCFSFILIYSGLAALIFNRKPNNGRINNCDIQVSDALQDVQHLGQPDKTI